MFGINLTGPGAGGFGEAFPPEIKSQFGVRLRGPGRGGYGPDFFVEPSGEIIIPFDPLVVDTALSRAMPWRDTREHRLAMALAYGQTVPISIRRSFEYDQTVEQGDGVALPWKQTLPRQTGRALPWQITVPKSRATSVNWRQLDPKAAQRSMVWDQTEPLAQETTARWRDTEPNNPRALSAWRDTDPADKAWRLPFLHITDFRRSYDIPWQGTRQPPTIWKPPPIFVPPPEPPGPPPVYTPPAGNNVALPFNCDLIPTPGDQVALPFRRFQCLRRAFVVDNDISIKRVDNDAAVAATSVRVGGDLESFAFSFSASVPREAGLEIVDPTDGPVEVEVNINGQVFLCLVESWSDDRTWRGARRDEIVLSGRSVVAELDEPYSAPRNYPRGSGDTRTLTAVQRMIEEIPLGSGWAIEPSLSWTNWPIPQGSLQYSGLTPIRAIALIAQASGAVVQPKPDERVLQILPRYPASPWHIDDAEFTAEIDYGVVTADRGQWLSNRDSSPHLGIYVEGETNGVQVLARITGTAGEWAEPVLEPLCTHPQAGLQRAIRELGQSWTAAQIGLQIPMGTQGDDNPGWIAPGQVVQIVESVDSSWKGVTTAWEIAGQWDDASGLVVDQRVEIERYLELSQ